MVQIISLESILKKDIPKTTKISNTDFLELFLKENKSFDIKNILSEKNTKDKKDNKDLDILDMDKLVLNSKLDLNIEEMKKIIDSKFKQNNIILSKQEIKEFKKIDNIKDLISFAQKKGLNIKKITFDIESPKMSKSNILTNTIIKNKLQDNSTSKNQNTKTNTKIDSEIKLENILKETKNTISKSQKKDSKNVVITTKDITKTKSDKDSIKIKNSRVDTNPTKNSQNITNNDVITNNTLKDTKKLHIKTSKETKNPKIIQNNQKVSNSIDNDILKKIVDDKNVKLDKNLEKDVFKPKEINLEELLNEPKKTKNSQTPILNHQNITQTDTIKAKSIQARQTIDSFKNNLDEAIKNYKPPVSKVNIELNPKNLGKVEVTIIKRGNSIQVNMHTDQNNINLFQTHQAEFRQALANIGFSNIDMNFNTNDKDREDREKQKRQNQAKKIYKENEEAEIEIKADYRYA